MLFFLSRDPACTCTSFKSVKLQGLPRFGEVKHVLPRLLPRLLLEVWQSAADVISTLEAEISKHKFVIVSKPVYVQPTRSMNSHNVYSPALLITITPLAATAWTTTINHMLLTSR